MRRDVFQAIADPTRRSILMSLSKETQNVNSLAEKFDMTRQAVSLHVKILQQCGVITIRKEGRERFCDLRAQKLTEVDHWLEPFRKVWETRFDQLDDLLHQMQTNQKKEKQ